MTPGHDFVTDLENAVTMGVIVFVIVILLVFFALRLLWWIRRRGFRPTYGALGNAMILLAEKGADTILGAMGALSTVERLGIVGLLACLQYPRVQ